MVGCRQRPALARRSGAIDLSLAPYESRFLLLDATTGGAVVDRPPASATPLDTGWTMAAPGSARTAWTDLRGWTADPRLATYSGTITYRRTLRIDTPLAGRCVALDFGAAPPVAASPLARPFAAVAAPVRDAAVVRVNGRRVGALWSPPYRIDLAPALKQGDNVVELEVANTALNALSAMPAPDLRLLHLRYGQRFAPQDTELIAAQPSGLLRHPQLAWGWQGSAGCAR